jgi:hypothetical protein
MFGLDVLEKRARFNSKARSPEAIAIQGSRSLIRNADGKNYTSDRKFAWMHARPAGSKADYTIVSKLATRSNESNVDCGVKPGELKISDVGTGVQQQHQKDATMEASLQNSKDSSIHAESGVSRDGPKHACTKSIGAKGISLHADLEPNVHTHLEKAVVRSGTSNSVSVCANPKPRGISKFDVGGPSNQRKIVSAKHREFVSKLTVRQYRPRYSGGSRIKSVAPGTKPRP